MSAGLAGWETYTVGKPKPPAAGGRGVTGQGSGHEAVRLDGICVWLSLWLSLCVAGGLVVCVFGGGGSEAAQTLVLADA